MIVGGSLALIPGVVFFGMGLGWNFAPLSVPGAVITAGGGTVLGLGIRRRIRGKQGRLHTSRSLRLGWLPPNAGPRAEEPRPQATPQATPRPARSPELVALRRSTGLITAGSVLTAGVAMPTLMNIMGTENFVLTVSTGATSLAVGGSLIVVGLWRRHVGIRQQPLNPTWETDRSATGNGGMLMIMGGLATGLVGIPLMTSYGLFQLQIENGEGDAGTQSAATASLVLASLALAGGTTMLSIGGHRRTRAKYLVSDTADPSSEPAPATSPTFSLHSGAAAPMSIRPGVAYGRPVRTYGFQLRF